MMVNLDDPNFTRWTPRMLAEFEKEPVVQIRGKTYRRVGVCARCGECCRHNPNVVDKEEVCTQLKDNDCKLHGSKKPLVCRLFPTIPHELDEFPFCKFTFEVVDGD